MAFIAILYAMESVEGLAYHCRKHVIEAHRHLPHSLLYLPLEDK